MKAEPVNPRLAAVVASASRRLAEADIENARRDAMLLMAHLLESDIGIVYREGERELSVNQQAAYEAMIRRRAAREPISHITGHREFWSLDFLVSADVLDPRADSETLIEAALEHVKNGYAPHLILDLGTGSGCLLLALLHELPEATGVGVDVSEAALLLAQKNAVRLGLAERARFIKSSWGEKVTESFDLVISNPPYIPASHIATLQPEVREYDPRLALVGGDDGLDCYRAILADIGRLLRPDGLLLFEVGAGQAPEVGRLMGQSGLCNVRFYRDLAGIERCIAAISGK
ncbi:MAG: protein-(glutamine-N5) methyltransferase, release factor-specific [Sneathiella sp.]|uniref:peptide chain release factor N(5)-glutamine methyltransferase n=1 Tax=Sneathiella sp. TaxID=1964365 RepID=UPI000C62682B|nr:peptide chain release factor N(5)-glutamine methyltransferase [Sneathiella sp.]MAL78429.1 protein-(glutamine-N5) methyltransferase, release factor-specific [Sneathiella sp.]